MTQHRSGPTIRPAVIGIPALPRNGLESPRVELLARIAVAGGNLTTVETHEVCAAVVVYLEARETGAH